MIGKHPGTKIDWSKVSVHGLERMGERGVTKKWLKVANTYSSLKTEQLLLLKIGLLLLLFLRKSMMMQTRHFLNPYLGLK